MGGGLGVCNDKLLQESLNEKKGVRLEGRCARSQGAVADAGEVAPLHTILHHRKAQKKGQKVACVWRDGCSAQLRVAVNTFLCQMQKNGRVAMGEMLLLLLHHLVRRRRR